MRESIMVGIALAFTGLLLVFRSLFFQRRGGKLYRVHLMNRPDIDDDQHESDSSEEWPSVIGAEQDSASEPGTISEDQRIELAVMQDRIIRMLP
jgi:hypothetical protein